MLKIKTAFAARRAFAIKSAREMFVMTLEIMGRLTEKQEKRLGVNRLSITDSEIQDIVNLLEDNTFKISHDSRHNIISEALTRLGYQVDISPTNGRRFRIIIDNEKLRSIESNEVAVNDDIPDFSMMSEGSSFKIRS